jgi:hypothetical protein
MCGSSSLLLPQNGAEQLVGGAVAALDETLGERAHRVLDGGGGTEPRQRIAGGGETGHGRLVQRRVCKTVTCRAQQMRQPPAPYVTERARLLMAGSSCRGSVRTRPGGAGKHRPT